MQLIEIKKFFYNRKVAKDAEKRRYFSPLRALRLCGELCIRCCKKNNLTAPKSNFVAAKLRSILNSLTGFTMVELVMAMVLLSILTALSYSVLRTPKEKLVCKNILSAMQIAKLRAITTTYNAYVDFDMDGGNVSDTFYTVYVDTDSDGAFGETSNASADDEFAESHFNMPDSLGGVSGTDLPSGTTFGLPNPNPAAGVYPGSQTAFPADGVDFGGLNEVSFTSKGTATNSGGVYVYDQNKTDRICAATVLSTGIVRMWVWNGATWS